MQMKVLGKDHPDTLISMKNLALTYRDQERQRNWKKNFGDVNGSPWE